MLTLTAEQWNRIIQWADLLESGEYQQGKGRLKDGCQYCCLGVLCEMYMEEEAEAWQWSKYDELMPLGEDVVDTWAILPPLQITQWIGLEHIYLRDLPGRILDMIQLHFPEEESPLDKDFSLETALAQINDRHATFEDIAGILRAVAWEAKVTP